MVVTIAAMTEACIVVTMTVADSCGGKMAKQGGCDCSRTHR